MSILLAIQAGLFQNIIYFENNEIRYRFKKENYIEYITEFTKKCINFKNKKMVLYRGLYNIKNHSINLILPHPIPFSTSLSLEFSTDWVADCNHAIVLHIYLEDEFSCIIVDQDMEREVVLPPGIIKLNDLLFIDDNNIYHYKCSYKQNI